GPRLQRGRAHVSAERAEMRVYAAESRAASTGPRSRERGEIVASVTPQGVTVASTGPRSRERGENAKTHWVVFMKQLQRGRAHVSAERRRGHTATPRCSVASTGPRSRERGEWRASRKATRRWMRFNGA